MSVGITSNISCTPTHPKPQIISLNHSSLAYFLRTSLKNSRSQSESIDSLSMVSIISLSQDSCISSFRISLISSIMVSLSNLSEGTEPSTRLPPHINPLHFSAISYPPKLTMEPIRTICLFSVHDPHFSKFILLTHIPAEPNSTALDFIHIRRHDTSAIRHKQNLCRIFL